MSETKIATPAPASESTRGTSLHPDSRRDWLRTIFREIDGNGDGVLDLTECAVALNRAHLPSDLNSVRRMRYAIRGEKFQEKTGRDITFDEFEKFYAARVEKLARHFHRFCDDVSDSRFEAGDSHQVRDEKRHVLLGTLRRVVEKETGCKVTDATVRQVFEILDLDGDGEISLDEWLRALLLVHDIEADNFIDQLFHHSFSGMDFGSVTKPSPNVQATKSQDRSYIFLKKAACGAFAGAISRGATAPIDRIRVVMQVTTPKPSFNEAVRIILRDGQTPWTKTTAFFSGNAANTLKIGGELAIKLQAYDQIWGYFTGNDPAKATLSTRIMAGGAAGFLGECVSHPLDVVRTRLAAAHRGVYHGIIHCGSVIHKEGGIRAFYAGMVPSLVGITPYCAIDLSANQILRERAREYMKEHNKTSSVPLLFGCGCTSSSFAMTCTFPLYVLKTRMAVTNEDLRSAIRAISQEKMGFYRGFMPALMKVVPASGISYSAYYYLDHKL